MAMGVLGALLGLSNIIQSSLVFVGSGGSFHGESVSGIFRTTGDDWDLPDINHWLATHKFAFAIEELAFSGCYLLASLGLILGVRRHKRWLILPYLVIQMLIILALVGVGILAVVLVSTQNLILAGITGGLIVILSILLVYLWFVVRNIYTRYGGYRITNVKEPKEEENGL